MPFRTKDVLQVWLDEFAEMHPTGNPAFVADQEAVDGRDSGLVIFPLQNATTSVYIQPLETGAPEWRVTIEAQPEITELSSESLHELCAELGKAADLCAHLQRRSQEHVARVHGTQS